MSATGHRIAPDLNRAIGRLTISARVKDPEIKREPVIAPGDDIVRVVNQYEALVSATRALERLLRTHLGPNDTGLPEVKAGHRALARLKCASKRWP
jgi:hypothetical protein